MRHNSSSPRCRASLNTFFFRDYTFAGIGGGTLHVPGMGLAQGHGQAPASMYGGIVQRRTLHAGDIVG